MAGPPVTLQSALDSGRIMLMDGAMGTELRRRGLADSDAPALWNLTHPRQVLQVHRDYASAGARVLLTNTFQANPDSLTREGAADSLEELCWKATELARQAVPSDGYVLADLGPLTSSERRGEFSDWHALGRIVAAFGPVDGYLIETCSTPQSLEAVQYIRHRAAGYEGQPILLSLSYLKSSDGQLHTHGGLAPETFARHAKFHGVAALGVNCGRDIGLEDVVEILGRYRRETDLPLFARPNAGSPIQSDDCWAYPLTPSDFSAAVPRLRAAGAVMIGGCCGTTPAHILACGRELDAMAAPTARQ